MCPDKAKVIVGDRLELIVDGVSAILNEGGHSVGCSISPVADARALRRVRMAVEMGAEVAVFGKKFIEEGLNGKEIVDVCRERDVSIVVLSAQPFLPTEWADVVMARDCSRQELLDVIKNL